MKRKKCAWSEKYLFVFLMIPQYFCMCTPINFKDVTFPKFQILKALEMQQEFEVRKLLFNAQSFR